MHDLLHQKTCEFARFLTLCQVADTLRHNINIYDKVDR
jgi:hypothetical protein